MQATEDEVSCFFFVGDDLVLQVLISHIFWFLVTTTTTCRRVAAANWGVGHLHRQVWEGEIPDERGTGGAQARVMDEVPDAVSAMASCPSPSSRLFVSAAGPTFLSYSAPFSAFQIVWWFGPWWDPLMDSGELIDLYTCVFRIVKYRVHFLILN